MRVLMGDAATPRSDPGLVMLGLGGTVDYEVAWDEHVFTGLVDEYGIQASELDQPHKITTERDLVVSVLAFMQDGVGGERYVSSPAIIQQLANRLTVTVTLGGTCVRAATAMAAVGVPSTLHLVSINDVTRELLPAGVDWISSTDRDSVDPHLIVQHPKGAKVPVGDIDVVGRAPNRLIYAHDPAHRELELSNQLDARLADAKIFVLSSLNAVQDRGLLDARLARLRDAVGTMSDDAIVVFEDAGYHVPEFAAVVRDALAPIVDVYSLNEDELQGHLARRIDLLDATSVAAAVQEFSSVVDVPALVVHTREWALALGPSASRYAHALLGGTTLAAARYRHGDALTREAYDATMLAPPQEIGERVARDLRNELGSTAVCVASPAVDSPNPTTIGLGDTFLGGFVATIIDPSLATKATIEDSPTELELARPIVFPSNRPPDRFYRGGRQITELRGDPPAGHREPEDWVASTTSVFGQAPVGLTMLEGGISLDSHIRQHPGAWLGPAHVASFGADTKLLVKLLDAGQRLPVHAHPDATFARRHLGHAHGKAEAWFILEGGSVHLGLVDDVDLRWLGEAVANQEVEALLGMLHRVEVVPGDVVYVPPGVLHAIGEGVFLVELQEPEDLSILLEWRDFALDGERDGHLGLGFKLALQAVEHRARAKAEMAELVQPSGHGPSILPHMADRYFRLERVALRGDATIDPGFAVVVTLSGTMTARGRTTSAGPGLSCDLFRGVTVALPHATGPLRIGGHGEVLVCRPPVPQAATVL